MWRHSGAAPHFLTFDSRYSCALSLSPLQLYYRLTSRRYPFSTGCAGFRARLAFWKRERHLCPTGDRTPLLYLSICSLIKRAGADTTRCHFVDYGNVVNSKLIPVRCYYHLHHHHNYHFTNLVPFGPFQPLLHYVLTSNEISYAFPPLIL
jgi:hypothetical protein